MIDEFTRQRFLAIQARALHDGVPLVEALDDARMIQTEVEIKRQWAQCLEQLWQNIDIQPEVALIQLGDGQNTPRDIKRGILRYIEIFHQTFTEQAGL